MSVGALISGALTWFGVGGAKAGIIAWVMGAWAASNTYRAEKKLRQMQSAGGPQNQFGARYNLASEETVKPLIYGTCKIWPNVVWELISPDGQTKQMLLEIGEGEIHSVASVQVDGKDIAGLTGCSYTAYLGTTTQTLDSRVVGSPTIITSCETTDDWTTTAGMTKYITGDCKEGNLAILGQVLSPTPTTIYSMTYNPASTWDLSAEQTLNLWLKSSRASTAFTTVRAWIYDTSGNGSYWDVTSLAANTWTDNSFALASPDGHNGTAADLTAITSVVMSYHAADGVSFNQWIDYIRTTGTPTETVGGMRSTAYIAVTLTISDEIGSDPTITCIVEGIECTYWNGSAWVQDTGWTHSSNPANILSDILLRSKEIGGLGVAAARIDGASFKTIADYCDVSVDGQPRWTFNRSFDERRPAPDILNEIMSSFGGIPKRGSDGKLYLECEKSASSAQTFNFSLTNPADNNVMPNSLGIEINDWAKQYNRVNIGWVDPNTDYTISYTSATDNKDVSANGLRELTVDVIGKNNFKEASRLAWMLLNEIRLCRYAVSFRTGILATAREPWDVITLAHDVPGWTAQPLRILQISRNGDELQFLCKLYDASLYSDTVGAVEPTTHPSTLPNVSDVPPNVTNLTLTEGTMTLSDGTSVPTIEVTWNEPPAYSMPLKYRVWLKSGVGGTYEMVNVISGDTFYTINVREPATYYVVIQTESMYGIAATFATSPEDDITITGEDTYYLYRMDEGCLAYIPFNGSLYTHRGIAPVASGAATLFKQGKFDGAVSVDKAATNLVANPMFTGIYAAGLAPSWEIYGTPTLSENTDPGYVQFRQKSQHVVSDAAEEGVHQHITVVTATAYTASAWVYVVSGRVQTSIVSGANSIQTITPAGHRGWYKLDSQITSDGTGVIFYIFSYTSAAEFYADGAQLETGSFSTACVVGSRAAGLLSYPSHLIPIKEGTIALWVKRNSAAENNGIIGLRADSPVTTYIFGILNYETGNDLYFSMQSSTGTMFSIACDDANTADVTNWHHYALSWDATSAILYCDGAAVGSDTSVTNLDGEWTQSYFNIGTYYNTAIAHSNWFNDFAVWNRKLSANEIAAICYSNQALSFGGATGAGAIVSTAAGSLVVNDEAESILNYTGLQQDGVKPNLLKNSQEWRRRYENGIYHDYRYWFWTISATAGTGGTFTRETTGGKIPLNSAFISILSDGANPCYMTQDIPYPLGVYDYVLSGWIKNVSGTPVIFVGFNEEVSSSFTLYGKYITVDSTTYADWVYVEIPFTGHASATQLQVYINVGYDGSSYSAGEVGFDGFKLELGKRATPFLVTGHESDVAPHPGSLRLKSQAGGEAGTWVNCAFAIETGIATGGTATHVFYELHSIDYVFVTVVDALPEFQASATFENTGDPSVTVYVQGPAAETCNVHIMAIELNTGDD